MRTRLIAFAMCALSAQVGASGVLAEKSWNHGSADCATNQDPAIEVFEFDSDTYILRQNKCVNFEAPFIYVLFGKHTVFIQDTGASVDAGEFPLLRHCAKPHRPAAPARGLIKILVTHSHSHRDHTAADPQFRGKPGVTLIEPNAKDVREYFGFSAWPEGSATVDLGGRLLEVVPAPGHQDEGIAVYDSRTGWLLTGDNLYPGRLYVKNWNEYRSSMRRLVEFSKSRRISAVLGTHIEISGSGKLVEDGEHFSASRSRFGPDRTGPGEARSSPSKRR